MLGLTTPRERQEIIGAINSGLADGSLAPIVAKSFSLSEAPQSHIEVLSPAKGSSGKVVLSPWE
jgi:NADPH:quinone reductase-like Zn-dependent oxidoreductase